jgi:hypothetical protein
MSATTSTETINEIIAKLQSIRDLKAGTPIDLENTIQKYLSEMMKELKEMIQAGFDRVIEEIHHGNKLMNNSEQNKTKFPGFSVKSNKLSNQLPQPPIKVSEPNSIQLSQPMASLRDEMLEELRILKDIMRGGKT